jgi:Na+/melibiose symporter-like transporter
MGFSNDCYQTKSGLAHSVSPLHVIRGNVFSGEIRKTFMCKFSPKVGTPCAIHMMSLIGFGFSDNGAKEGGESIIDQRIRRPLFLFLATFIMPFLFVLTNIFHNRISEKSWHEFR